MQSIAWRTIVEYIDIETGEVLHWASLKHKYKILKTIKRHETNKNRTQGRTTLTKLCKQLDRIQSTIF